MRNVIAFMHTSLDGFAAGPNGELDWVSFDEELFEAALAQERTVDTALYGRVTYQMMESYWPTVLTNPASTKNELTHANWVEKVQKVVFSKTLENATWNNTQVVKENIAEEIARLKQQPGENMMIFGSIGLTHTFMRLGLIDEYRISISPVILGKGIPLFEKNTDRTALKLLDARTLGSGVLWLHYRKEQDGSDGGAQ